MNLKSMPELDKTWGYPFVLGMMIRSVVAPSFVYFRRKGFLRLKVQPWGGNQPRLARLRAMNPTTARPAKVSAAVRGSGTASTCTSAMCR